MERRKTDRYPKAGDAMDVSRLEYENLAAEVMKNAHLLARIEQEVVALREAVKRLRSRD